MKHIDFIIDKFENNLNKDAIIWNNESYIYSYLLEKYHFWEEYLTKSVYKGAVVAVQADYSPDSVTLLLALIENQNIVVPFSPLNKDVEKKIVISEAEYFIKFESKDCQLIETGIKSTHELIRNLQVINHPGIIIFSSGSTGEPKAAIHDFTKLLSKFKIERTPLRTINFLLFDHWGGLNTLLHIFSNAGVVGIINERTPKSICEFIQKHKIELLPTTPTFINLLLMSRVHEDYDLSSLKIVSYGTEAMPESTLKAFHEYYPNIKLKQTYGLTELGVMRTRSKNSESLWVQVGGEDYKIKVVDNILFIKATSTILGYLNAESPYDQDGWYNTGDIVEQDGEWLKFLGRNTDLINVGGQKVYPAEVESVILEMENIKEVAVFGKDNPILGKIVVARINIDKDESLYDLKKRIRTYCKTKLESFKIPMEIEIASKSQVTDRFKKIR
jgi:long-chain acyl-CoA synthetase